MENKPNNGYPNNIKAVYSNKYGPDILEAAEKKLLDKAEEEHVALDYRKAVKVVHLDYCLGCRRVINHRVYLETDKYGDVVEGDDETAGKSKKDRIDNSEVKFFVSPEGQHICEDCVIDCIKDKIKK